jgi:hypothetical protein
VERNQCTDFICSNRIRGHLERIQHGPFTIGQVCTDTAVKRTIDQAGQNQTLDSFDVQMLRTLFMIRYVDIHCG